MGDNTAKHDPDATQAFSTRGGDASYSGPPLRGSAASGSSKSGRLEVRCPSCHMPTDVEADTTLTDLTCGSCGSHFSLIDQSQTTQMAPPLSTMGRFELVERLGVGGFGSVWKARDKELDRTVAIKIPRAIGMTAEEQEKFFREARAAAQLRHPAIVSVHEVGRDGESVYIVSDFVRGVTLGDWLSGQQLTSREAAEICAKVADALEHAHEQGVVHRDLKPANIMMDYDGEPHLMDFGLARRESGEVTLTVDGQVLGTPAYMSPEQAQGEAHRADRRSDIYSLGVILFQLLTRELPFRGNARMLVKQVIHDEPPSPRKLNSHVAKDLETITLKCLEKEPARRYQTARELCDELKRHLAGEPIHARPISGLERAWRWCKRNSLAAALMLTVAATLTAGVIASSYYAASASREAAATKVALRQAEAERKRVERVNTFFMDEVFGLADPTSFDRAGISLVEALDIAASKIDQRFADDPELRVAIQDRLGDIYRTIDEPQKAQAQLEKAVATWKELAGPMDPRALKSRGNLGMVLFNEGRFSEAKALLQSTLADQTQVIGAGHPDAVRTAINLGLVLMDMRDDHDVETAENTYQNALKALGPRSTITFDAQSSYAWTLRWRGQSEKALPLAKAAAFGLREASGGDDLRTMYAVYNYASCLADVGQFSEAVDELKVLLATRRRVLGPAHVDTIYTAWRYAQFSRRSGDDAAALAVLDDVCANLDAIEATGNLRRAGPLMMFAGVVEGMGQDEKVAQIQAATYKIYSRALDRGDQVESANFLNALAWAMATSSLDKFRNGKRAVELATKACELSNYHDANIVDTLAAAYAEVGDFDAAVKWSEKSLELLGDKDPAKRESFSAALTKYKAKEPMRIAPISPATRKRVMWSVPNLPDPGSEATTGTTTSTGPPTDKK